MSNARPPVDRRAATMGFAIVVAANFLYLTGLPLILDPVISTEPFYIEMAQQPLSGILGADAAWGPLYAVWLKPFVAALGDPVLVYAANLYTLSIGVTVLIYLYLLLLTRRAAAGVGAALFFLVCDLNVPLCNKVSSFALMVILTSLTVSELLPAGARRMSVTAAGVLLAAYARPELYPAALTLCLAAFWLARREGGESERSVFVWPATTMAAILICALWSGTPLFGPSHSGDRLFMAFREHFAWNWSKWHNQQRDLFSIWEQDFGGALTTLQAVLNNPSAVMHHLIDNLRGTLSVVVTSTFDHYPLLAPATRPDLVKAESLLVSAAVFGILFLAAVRPGLRLRMLDTYGHVLFPYATVATFSVAAATVIFPLTHYLVIPEVLLMLAATQAATLIIPATGLAWRTRVLVALACLAAVPKPFVLPSAYVVSGSPFKGRIAVVRTITDTIGFVRSLRLPAPVRVLTVNDGIGEMLGRGFQEVKLWKKGAQPLDAYVRDNDIALIINLEPGRDSFLVNDPYWERVQINPDAVGFTRVFVPSHEAVGVYVRSELIPRQRESTP